MQVAEILPRLPYVIDNELHAFLYQFADCRNLLIVLREVSLSGHLDFSDTAYAHPQS